MSDFASYKKTPTIEAINYLEEETQKNQTSLLNIQSTLENNNYINGNEYISPIVVSTGAQTGTLNSIVPIPSGYVLIYIVFNGGSSPYSNEPYVYIEVLDSNNQWRRVTDRLQESGDIGKSLSYQGVSDGYNIRIREAGGRGVYTHYSYTIVKVA